MIYHEFKENQDRYLDTSKIQPKITDIPYSDESPRCKLDLYYPSKDQESYPLIIFFHGGAFLKGDKQRYQLFSALQGTFNGFAVASVNYRLLPEFHYLEYLKDASAAVRFLINHFETYKIDKENIFLWGESAGAFLSLLVGLTGQDGGVEKLLQLPIAEEIKINGIVSWYAPTNLLKHPDMKVLGEQSLNELKYRQQGESLQETLRRLSPINLLTENSPKLYIQHGLKDTVVPPEQAVELAGIASEYLSENELKIEYLVEGDHSTGRFSQEDNLEKIFLQLNKWLDKE